MPGFALNVIRLWLAGRWKWPSCLRVQCGLSCGRGRSCFGRNFFCWRCFFSRCSFLGDYLLGWCCFFSRYSFLGDYLLGWYCFFSRYSFLGDYLLGWCCFFSRGSFLGRYFRCWSSLFRWCDFFWGWFFCSCHCFLLDQFTKSTSCGLESKKRCMLLGTIPAT